ncbi:hypothetical protein HZC32_01200 [Candidatus Woesearchaeota archaeon]|nr:hypothetical protein [Candidatus Woesearchaeota archaeon]
MNHDHSFPHAYAGTEIFASVFTPKNGDFRICVIATPIYQNFNQELNEKEKKDISDLLLDIPDVECRDVNGDYSIIVKTENNSKRLFSYFGKCFRETRINETEISNRKLLQYQKIVEKLSKEGYRFIEFKDS